MTASQLSEQQLLEFHQRLEAEKSRLSTENSRALEDLMDSAEFGGDSLDRTTAEQTNSTRLLLKDRKMRLLFDIEAALDRLSNNTYGLCQECGEPLPPARLQLNPSASLCVECQEEFDEERRRSQCRPGLLDDPNRY